MSKRGTIRKGAPEKEAIKLETEHLIHILNLSCFRKCNGNPQNFIYLTYT